MHVTDNRKLIKKIHTETNISIPRGKRGCHTSLLQFLLTIPKLCISQNRLSFSRILAMF